MSRWSYALRVAALVLFAWVALGVGAQPGRPSFGPLAVDPLSDSLQVIDFAHHECHEGDCFLAQSADLDIDVGDTIIFAFKTPPGTKRAHLVVEFTTLIDGHLELWEGATWTAETGTELAIINRKREASPNSSVLLADQAQAGFVAADVIHLNPTGLNTGSATSLHHIYACGTKTSPAVPGGRDLSEFLLEPDETCTVVFTSMTINNKAQAFLYWYEHTDSD